MKFRSVLDFKYLIKFKLFYFHESLDFLETSLFNLYSESLLQIWLNLSFFFTKKTKSDLNLNLTKINLFFCNVFQKDAIELFQNIWLEELEYLNLWRYLIIWEFYAYPPGVVIDPWLEPSLDDVYALWLFEDFLIQDLSVEESWDSDVFFELNLMSFDLFP